MITSHRRNKTEDECPFKSHTFRFLWKIFNIIYQYAVIWPCHFLLVEISMLKISPVHKKLSKARRVDLFPFKEGRRGFTLVLDQKEAFYFVLDGDHFIYGKYEKGWFAKSEVTIFDKLRQS